MRKIKRNDEVIVIAGRDKGKRGEVLRVLDDGRLVISGVNLVKKHQRGNPQLGQAPGIVSREAPIDASNVAIFNAESGKADRVGFRMEGENKIRIFKSSGKVV